MKPFHEENGTVSNKRVVVKKNEAMAEYYSKNAVSARACDGDFVLHVSVRLTVSWWNCVTGRATGRTLHSIPSLIHYTGAVCGVFRTHKCVHVCAFNVALNCDVTFICSRAPFGPSTQ